MDEWDVSHHPTQHSIWTIIASFKRKILKTTFILFSCSSPVAYDVPFFDVVVVVGVKHNLFMFLIIIFVDDHKAKGNNTTTKSRRISIFNCLSFSSKLKFFCCLISEFLQIYIYNIYAMHLIFIFLKLSGCYQNNPVIVKYKFYFISLTGLFHLQRNIINAP